MMLQARGCNLFAEALLCFCADKCRCFKYAVHCLPTASADCRQSCPGLEQCQGRLCRLQRGRCRGSTGLCRMEMARAAEETAAKRGWSNSLAATADRWHRDRRVTLNSSLGTCHIDQETGNKNLKSPELNRRHIVPPILSISLYAVHEFLQCLNPCCHSLSSIPGEPCSLRSAPVMA